MVDDLMDFILEFIYTTVSVNDGHLHPVRKIKNTDSITIKSDLVDMRCLQSFENTTKCIVLYALQGSVLGNQVMIIPMKK